MKQNPIILIIISLFLVVSGVLNIFLWNQGTGSIYGLVFGVISLILAWFVFHFRKRK